MAVVAGAVAVAGGSTPTVVLPTILAAVEGTEAEAAGISKVRSKIIWFFVMQCDY